MAKETLVDGKVQEKIGFFSQEFTVGLSQGDYVLEKVTLPPIKKKNIVFRVQPGTVALVGGQKFKGAGTAYELSSLSFTDGKNVSCDIFLFPDKHFESVTVNFFGGQHEVTLSAALSKMARAKFAIVGSASIEIADYKDLARYYNRSLTKEELVEEINKNYRVHLTNEVSATASKYITPETTEVDLQAKLNEIVADVMQNSRKTSTMMFDMGLMISQRGISLHLNPLDDADEKFKLLSDALMKKELDSYAQDERDREAKERQAERQHEIDKIRAENTTREESDSTKNYSNNGTAPLTINDRTGSGREDGYFCDECGKKVRPGAKFCPHCGEKL